MANHYQGEQEQGFFLPFGTFKFGREYFPDMMSTEQMSLHTQFFESRKEQNNNLKTEEENLNIVKQLYIAGDDTDTLNAYLEELKDYQISLLHQFIYKHKMEKEDDYDAIILEFSGDKDKSEESQ